MAFREVSVVEIKEILRRWQRKESFRNISAALGADRKTIRRYVAAARRHGLDRELATPVSDELLGLIVGDILPGAPPSAGAMRAHCRLHRLLIEGWVKDGCRAPKIVRLLQAHIHVAVPERTLRRYIAEELEEARGAGTTVRLVESPPGQVLEIDFMEFGKVRFDGEECKLFGLVCVAACSRHLFVWPCLRTTTADVIAGLEAAWAFFGGIFPIVLPDNPKTIVARADPLAPVFNAELVEYSQSRGFVLDPARVRHPKDKPHVERAVPYVRHDGFSAERYLDLDSAKEGLARWCKEVAGQRRHGTTRRRPAEAFESDEKALLLPPPMEPYDTPRWVEVTVGRDHAISVGESLYSVPHSLRGESLRVRLDRSTVKMYHKNHLAKIHARVAPGKSSIDPADLPEGTGELATRDAESFREQASRHGSSVGEYAGLLLEGPQPWTRMRQVYRLLGLCKRYGGSTVDLACRAALDLEVVDVTRIARMLEQQNPPPENQPPPSGKVLRFGRDPSEFRRSHA
jgi:transposase